MRDAYVQQVWGVENVTGNLVRFDPNQKTVSVVDEHPLNFLGFTGKCYINTVSKRVGQFGGYGDFKCHNQRREFDVSNNEWILAQEKSHQLPYPRNPDLFLCRSKQSDKIILFGGNGNVSGKQSDRVPSLKGYNGKYYPLNDLWELDFKSNQWRQLLEPQKFNPTGLKAIICHKPSDSILFLTGSESGRPQPAQFHRSSGRVGEVPKPLPNEGESIEMFQYWCVLVNPENEQLMVFADEGVFEVSIVPV